MSATISQQVPLDPTVRGFLAQHDAEADFSRVCELVQSCSPALIGLELTLQADADEEARVQVLLIVTLPWTYPDEQLQLALKQYHSRLIAEIPLSHCPLFALVAEF